MKIEKNKRKHLEYSLIAILSVLTLIFLLVFFALVSRLERPLENQKKNSEKPSYHVLLCSLAENERSLMRIYEGVEQFARQENLVLDLYIPYSRGEDVSLQKLLNFASYTNADGVLFWNSSLNDSVKPVFNKSGDLIPLVTLGSYSKKLPAISHITSDYAGEGKSLALSIIQDYQKESKVLILNYSNCENQEFKEMETALCRGLKEMEISSVEVISLSPEKAKTELKKCFSENLNQDFPLIIVALSEFDTLQAAQVMNDFYEEQENSSLSERKIHLIGFGKNDSELFYLDEGLIDQLFMTDYVQNGKAALESLLNYKKSGISSEKVLIPFLKMKKQVKNAEKSWQKNPDKNSQAGKEK